MEIGTSGNAEYSKLDSNKIDTHFSLDLHTVDALDPERIAKDLEVRKNHVRNQIFRNIANEVIPNMVWGHRKGEAPDQWSIESESSWTSSMATPKFSGGALNTDHHMEMDVAFAADREIDPTTMVYLARDHVAGYIADGMIFDMEQEFLGKSESGNTWELSTKDGEAEECQIDEENYAFCRNKEERERFNRTAENEDIFEGLESWEKYGPGNEVYEGIDRLYYLINDAMTAIRDLDLVMPKEMPDDLENILMVRRALRLTGEAMDIRSEDGYTIDLRKYEARKKIRRAIYYIDNGTYELGGYYPELKIPA